MEPKADFGSIYASIFNDDAKKGMLMISVVYNETLDAIEMFMDPKGADLLIESLQTLKEKGGHIHLYATNDDGGVSTVCPYPFDKVYHEVVLDLLPSDAWQDT
jgi:hypothetical protein